MRNAVERGAGALAGGLASFSAARPRLVLALAVGACLAAAAATATRLHVDTNPDLMTSPKLPFRQAKAALEEAFPGLRENLVVVVEADDPALARRSAERLADRLAAHERLFPRVFLPGHGPFWERRGLLYLDRETLARTAERLEAGAPLLRALEERPRLSTFLIALARGVAEAPEEAEEAAPVLDELAAAIDAFLRGERDEVDWERWLRAEAVDATPRRQLLFVEPSKDFSAFEPAREALAAVRQEAAALPPTPGLRVRITGDLAVLTEEMSMVRVQVFVAAAASLVLVALVLVTALRSVRLVLATLAALLAGLLWTSGFAALAVGHLNILTTAFAVLYVGLGVDFGIHWALGYRELRAAGEAPEPAAAATGHRVGGALVFCALTTAVGFFAFLPTRFTGVGELGLISGTGVFLSLLATLSVTPALLALGLGHSPKLETAPRRELRLPRWPARHRVAVRIAAAVSAVVAAAAATQLRFESDPLDVRDPRTESVQALRELLREGELSPWTIEVLAPDLEAARRKARRLEALPEVERAMTIEDWVPDHQQAKLRLASRMADALGTAAPEAREDAEPSRVDEETLLSVAIEDLLLQLEMDAALAPGDAAPSTSMVHLEDSLARLQRALRGTDPPDVDALDRALFGELPQVVETIRRAVPDGPVRWRDLPEPLRRRYVAPDGRARVEVFAAEDLSAPGALDRFADAVRAVEPGASGAVVGTVELARAIASALREALLAAVVTIALLLFVLFRELRATAVVLAPLGLGALWTAALCVAIGQPLNFANVIVLPLLLGIGVDSAIHLVERHRAGARGEALLATATARAVFWSALTSVASFATLAFASHRGIASLAQLLTSGVTLMLVATLIVLPALLAGGEAEQGAEAPGPAPRRAVGGGRR
jgi:hopanoid biosynthesis associated RND transporter like protein HpnN